ncbi:hypothetical protein ACI2KR_06645 [Pseudomonas luteola]
MSFDWASLSKDDLRDEAAEYRHDNDDGSGCFFDADCADWSYQILNPSAIGAFESAEEARVWIVDEISALRADGNGGRAASYEQMLTAGFSDPVVIGSNGGELSLWDGYHRTAIALVRGDMLPAIVGVSFLPAPSPRFGF